MVLLINGTPLDKCPESINQLYEQFGHLREGSARLLEKPLDTVGSARSLYVHTNEYAVVYDHDSSVDIVGTDTIGNTVVIILRSTTSCSTLVCHADLLTTSDMDMMVSSLNSASMLQMSMIGAYQSQAVVLSILSTMQSTRHTIELVTLAMGPLISGVGVNVKTGAIVPAKFSEKGPDMDLRTARTLAGGQQVSKLNIYNSVMEELTIGPFSYSPMRAVDIWLQMTDQFLLQSLCPCPEGVEDPIQHVSILRAALTLIKNHPYPAVTIFRHNRARTYSRDYHSGRWVDSVDTDWCYQQQYVEDSLPCSYQANMADYGLFKQEYAQWNNLQHQPVFY